MDGLILKRQCSGQLEAPARYQLSRSSQIEIVSHVACLLLERVSHVAHALTTTGKLLAADHNNIVISAVIPSMMDAVQAGYRSGPAGGVLIV